MVRVNFYHKVETMKTCSLIFTRTCNVIRFDEIWYV